MKIKNICIICEGYPSDIRMTHTFIEQLVNQFTDYGINCYVIAPQSLTRKILRGNKINKTKYYRFTNKKNIVKVYSPFYLTYSTKFAKFNLHGFRSVVNKQFSQIYKNVKFDVIYAHFIFCSGIIANEIGKKYNIPVFLAYGENSGKTINYLGNEKTSKLLDGIKGVIAVSSENKKRLVDNKIVPEKIIEVFPNAINNEVFYKKERRIMRKQLGYNEEDFIIAFVGRFIPLKGIDRLCDALNIINNDNIKAIFIGEGKTKPYYKNTLFTGELENTKIVDYLSASDIFVLPTIAEGCCNAIVEALACGLPVISSNKSFNDDILDDSCSIRIDSMNIGEIKEAIEKLYKYEELRNKLSIGALKKAKTLNIEKRAERIIEFMENNKED